MCVKLYRVECIISVRNLQCQHCVTVRNKAVTSCIFFPRGREEQRKSSDGATLYSCRNVSNYRNKLV